MALRWYSVVVDARDTKALSRWWMETLDWVKVYESEDEVSIVPRDWEDRFQTWVTSPPGLVFVPVPESKQIKNRLHIDLAPHLSDDRDAEIARLEARGATRVDVGQPADATFTVLADPEGNEFCVLSSRDQ